jgi:hypothetical protein
MAKSLIDTIDNTPFQGLAITNVHTGFNVSIEFERGKWSPAVFATSPSEAILKAIRLHAPAPSEKAAAPPLPPLPDLSSPILPPPY